jgi:hypothetical protein
MPNRAVRRAALAKKKRRAVQVYRYSNAIKLANHLKCCSGPCCGNPRKWFNRPTLQELRVESETSNYLMS